MTDLIMSNALIDCRRVFVKNYQADAWIGAYESELERPQKMRFNVDLFVALRCSTPERDELHEIVNSDIIASAIQSVLSRGHIRLQETMCDEIVAALFEEGRVRAVRVQTEKLAVYQGCESVGTEVFKIRPDGGK
ncbi:dihydroneopterin aldolase [Paraburkholderia dipogonis]|nr:dihydroneopterin aldolase [Paraburkholderia dipogonis]